MRNHDSSMLDLSGPYCSRFVSHWLQVDGLVSLTSLVAFTYVAVTQRVPERVKLEALARKAAISS